MSDVQYWLWLQKCVGYANDFTKIIEIYPDLEQLYNATNSELCLSEYFAKRNSMRKRLLRYSLEDVKEIYELCNKHNIHIVTYDSKLYPEKLRQTKCAPAVLYVRGDAECIGCENTVAVIGSRTPSCYGEESAREIVGGLVEKSIVIVSGGALGIDSVAHQTAIDNGGKTVLVMGCGHGTGYLMKNARLRRSVYESGGALVSEYPPFYPVGQATFPERNRIISGISKGVVIIEAADRSGTFSTAKHAVKQQRRIFVLPGDIKSGNFTGSNQLIIDGAVPIFSSKDILPLFSISEGSGKGPVQKNNLPFEKIHEESTFSKRRADSASDSSKKRKASSPTEQTEAPLVSNEVAEEKIIVKKLPEGVSKNGKIVYNLLSDGLCSIDELSKASELPAGKLLSALTELELLGIVEKNAEAYRLI